MKKIFIIVILVVGLFLLCGCTSTPSDLESHLKTPSYEIGYNEGYADGIAYVLSQLKENASSYEVYMNIEDVEESIRIYFAGDSSVDVDEIRDDIIFHPDIERFTLEDWVDTFIKENIEE